MLRAGPCMPGVVGAAGRLSPSARCPAAGAGPGLPGTAEAAGAGAGIAAGPGRAEPGTAMGAHGSPSGDRDGRRRPAAEPTAR